MRVKAARDAETARVRQEREDAKAKKERGKEDQKAAKEAEKRKPAEAVAKWTRWKRHCGFALSAVGALLTLVFRFPLERILPLEH